MSENGEEAAKWFHRAAEQGEVNACRVLGALYQFGECGVMKNLSEAEKWYRKAAEQGDTKAQQMIDSLYD